MFLGFWCISVQRKKYENIINCNKVNAIFRESPILYAARGMIIGMLFSKKGQQAAGIRHTMMGRASRLGSARSAGGQGTRAPMSK
jgi:hypothetical protein